MENKLLTEHDAAQILRLSSRRISRLIRAGNFAPHIVWPNGEFRFVESDFWDWVGSLPKTIAGETSEVTK